jgi:AcrR family transcriptional regulator
MPGTSPQQRPRPRKAPKQARSLETVKVIVEAAARVLEQTGLDGFSTNAVAERAGVSIGSLYQYFPRKEALIGALIVRETSLLIGDAEAAMAEPSGAAALAALVQAAIAHQFRRPTLARLLDFEEARLPFDADTRQVGERFLTILSNVLLRPDLPRQADGDAAARDIMAIIKGMVDAAGVHGETDQRKLSVRVHKAVFGYLNASL